MISSETEGIYNIFWFTVAFFFFFDLQIGVATWMKHRYHYWTNLSKLAFAPPEKVMYSLEISIFAFPLWCILFVSQLRFRACKVMQFS